MFNIVSVGDAAFMEQILMAVAMVTSVSSFEKMVSVGLLLGVIFVFIQSVFQGAKQVNIHQIFVGYLLYACLFVPVTTVVIEDAYTGDVRVVDNVPIGVGAAGGIISSVGYNITKLFEQGYGVIVPASMESRFGESLSILNSIRREGASPQIMEAMNTSLGAGTDLRKSWDNYIRECTLTKIDLGETSLDSMLQGELPETLRFQSQLFGTRLYLANPNGQDYTCSDGYIVLTQATNVATSGGSAYLSITLRNMLGIKDNQHVGLSGQNIINNSLDMLTDMSLDASKYLQAAVLEPIYLDAVSGKYMDFQDVASATMINQALQQRNTQWAAEQSMFMTVVKPMMTFFEGFVYAITPIMGFLFVLGGFGMSLAGKYLQTLLWIQLWMPVMSIINLYIHTAVSGKLSSIDGMNSIYGINESSEVLAHWISTGGMLFAATPVISLFIVTGSTYAFTSLAGRINGADHVNEKLASKDVATPGALIAMQPSNSFNEVSGRIGSGAEGMMGSVSFGTGLQSITSSASQNMEQAQQSFGQSLTSGLTGSTSSSQAYDRAATLGRAYTSAYGNSNNLVSSRVNKIMEDNKIGQEHKDAVTGAVISSLGGNLSGGVQASRGVSEKGSGGAAANVAANLQGGLQSTATSARTDGTSTTSGSQVSWADDLNFTEQEQAQFTNSLAHQVASSSRDTLTQLFGRNEAETLQKSAQNVVSTANSFQQADSLSSQFATQNTFNLKDVASQVGNNSEAMGMLNSYWNTGGVSSDTKQEAQRLYERYSSPTTEGGYGLSHNNALAAARIKALQNSNNHDGTSDRQFQNNYNAALQTISKGMNLAINPVGDYQRNSDQEQITNDGLTSRVEAGTESVSRNVAPGRNISMPNKSERPEQYSDPTSASVPSDVSIDHAKQTAGVYNSAYQKQDERYEAAEDPARANYMANRIEYDRMSAAELVGGVKNASDFTERQMERLAGTAYEAVSAAPQAYADKLEELKSNPELRQQVIQASRMTDDEYESSGLMERIGANLKGAGRSVIGAAAAGIELAQGEISFGDLRGMSFEEKGMIYEAALVHSMETSGAAGAAKFAETNSAFKEEFRQEAMSRGLTAAQAEIYAHSFDNEVLGVTYSTGAREQAIAQYTETFAERDGMRNEDGSIMRDENGKAILNPETQKFVDQQIFDIQESGRIGSNLSGAYMGSVSDYNKRTGRTGRLME